MDVNSSVWIDILNGNETPQVERLSALPGTEPLVIGDIILLEVLQGIRSEADAKRVEAALRRFDVQPMLDSSLVALAAPHHRRLCGLGIALRNPIDLIITTFPIARGHAPQGPIATSPRWHRTWASSSGELGTEATRTAMNGFHWARPRGSARTNRPEAAAEPRHRYR